MALPIPTLPCPPPTANEELATQIVAALRTAEFIAAADEDAASSLLTTGNVKVGEWRRILEKNLPATPTSTATNHATAHHAT